MESRTGPHGRGATYKLRQGTVTCEANPSAGLLATRAAIHAEQSRMDMVKVSLGDTPSHEGKLTRYGDWVFEDLRYVTARKSTVNSLSLQPVFSSFSQFVVDLDQRLDADLVAVRGDDMGYRRQREGTLKGKAGNVVSGYKETAEIYDAALRAAYRNVLVCGVCIADLHEIGNIAGDNAGIAYVRAGSLTVPNTSGGALRASDLIGVRLPTYAEILTPEPTRDDLAKPARGRTRPVPRGDARARLVGLRYEADPADPLGPKRYVDVAKPSQYLDPGFVIGPLGVVTEGGGAGGTVDILLGPVFGHPSIDDVFRSG